MPSDIKRRLEAAIREAEDRSRKRFREEAAVTDDVAEGFRPIIEAAQEIKEYLRSIPGIEVVMSPESVTIALGDLEFWVTYDPATKKYVGEETAPSWYDDEIYTERYTWSSAEECANALIKFTAQYVRMARAINRAAPRE